MRELIKHFILIPLLCGFWLTVAYAEMVPGADIKSVKEAKQIDVLLRQPERDMDLARVKLTIDKMIEPSIDVDAGVRQIDEMAAQVRAMLRPSASSTERLHALQRYIYEKGTWNGYQAFGYDFDDPLGKDIHNKLLPNYVKSRKGNCVTMPMLFVILGQRLSLDVTLSTAPLHFFVKYTNPETSITYNLETTSGANPARDIWIRQQNPMTDEAIANGLYMQKLSKRETASAMATTLGEYFTKRREHEKIIALSNVILSYYPKDVDSMLRKGSAYGQLGMANFERKYLSQSLIPPDKRSYFEYLRQQNYLWFARAEALGWREPSRSQETKYMQSINQAKSTQ